MYTIATAAAVVGRNKTAIMRAIEAGKIPVVHTEGGEMTIDPADLHRIFPPLRKDGARPALNQSPLLIAVGT